MKRLFGVIFTMFAALSIFGARAFASEPEADAKDKAKTEFVAKSFVGNVLSVTKDETQTEVLISDEDGNQTVFFLNGATYLLGIAPADIKKGAVLTIYYDATPSKPQLMIYPPQRTALVATKGKMDGSVKVGYFDANGLSYDEDEGNRLKLNIDSSIVVSDVSGNPSSEGFENKLIAVEYSNTTRSAPPQTTPTKITILETSSEKPADAAKFTVFSGTVQKVTETDGVKTYLVKNDGEFNLVEKTNVYYLDGAVKAGDKISAFVEDQPTTRIYPAKYKVSVIAKDLGGRSVKTDRFDDNLVSYDGTLKLILDDNTDVLLQDGSAYSESSFANRKLAVVYGVSTKSLPAIATPSKIVVLYEDAAPLSDETRIPEKTGLKINDKTISTLSIGTYEYAAFREAAEALGIDIEWDGDVKSVLINGLEILQIGNTTYSYGGSQVEFAAPELIDGKTYVPVEFLELLN